MLGLRTRVVWPDGSDRTPTAILCCSGEIDIGNIGCLERGLASGIATGAPVLEVDLRNVTYLDSCAIEALLLVHRDLTGAGRAFRVQASPRALRLFRLLGLDTVLEIHVSPDPASLEARPFGVRENASA